MRHSQLNTLQNGVLFALISKFLYQDDCSLWHKNIQSYWSDEDTQLTKPFWRFYRATSHKYKIPCDLKQEIQI